MEHGRLPCNGNQTWDCQFPGSTDGSSLEMDCPRHEESVSEDERREGGGRGEGVREREVVEGREEERGRWQRGESRGEGGREREVVEGREEERGRW